MKSSNSYNDEKMVDQGRAIARGIDEMVVNKAKGMAKAAKRQQTMLERAAEKALSGRA